MKNTIAPDTGNPFPGLRPFRGNEAYLFFGRESQVDVMVDKLARTHFLAVLGTSGSGKSSLVNCGLSPALHRGLMAQAGTCWRIVKFRPGSNPMRAMARALAEDDAMSGRFDFDLTSLQNLIEATLRMSKLGLSEVYKKAQLSAGTNLLIVVDQFEELFRYRRMESTVTGDAQSRDQEATAFVNLLLDAKTQATFPIYIVLTMRSDFLGDCAEFAGLPEAINEGQYLVPRLTRDERRAAISGPVGVGGAQITRVLLTRLVNDVGDNPDQLSILQHALNRTWAKWENEGKREGALDLPHYEAIGTMASALDHHAEKVYNELHSERQKKTCEKIFRALTDKGTDARGIRRPTKFETLCELAGASPEEVTEVINIFRKPSRSFLMPPLPEALEPDTIVDISHESLMRVWGRLKLWTDEEVQLAQLYRRLSETAALHAVGKAGLWDDPDLQFALDWKNKEQPTERWAELYGGGFAQVISFLTESQKQRDEKAHEKEALRERDLQQAQALAAERQQRIEQQAQAARRLWGWVAALAGVVVLLLFFVGYAERERILAEQADREMRLEALRMRDVNLDSMSSYADLADSLLQNASPEEAALWRGMKGDALLQLGNYEDAEPILTQALNVVPDDIRVRTSRGYLFLLLNQPSHALKDFEYIRDNIDNGLALNYLNLTIAQAELGDYMTARISLKKAIENAESNDFDGGSEAVIPPDITEVTGRTTLQADKATFLAALYYMQANLEAYVGNKEAFEAALDLADKKARPLPKVSQKDAYLVAMTWAWLQLGAGCPAADAHCRDYGALASQAALWERAGYKRQAACYYEEFQDKHAHERDARYSSFAQLVGRKRRKLLVLPVSSCLKQKTPERDTLTLETEAKEALARKKFQEANKLFDQALDKATTESDRMRLLLEKAKTLYLTVRAAEEKGYRDEARTTFLELIRNCDQILKKDPAVKAYFYRAMAQYWLDPSSPSSREKILDDTQRALDRNPADLDSLALLDDLAPDDQPGEDIAYLKRHRRLLARYYRMSPYTSKVFLHQAKLAKEDRQYEQSLAFIEKAIDIEPNNCSLYQVRKEIELASGMPAPQVENHLFFGHVQALFILERRDDHEDPCLLEIRNKIATKLAQNQAKH
jgi:tetratricopeptide (TPR) repeat protein